ncbi:MAG: hypothetical protein KatS3mg097_204 [Candidatus Parcubacteria bacterium]|nr:MAG: hypothetical protein KatS3mg097_204 [Candidatus Parcubacteria bacterium]
MIISLGTATLDIILKSQKIDSISLGDKVKVDNIFFALGGGAVNAAATFANLQLNCRAYFRLGDDLISQIILSKIKQAKIKYHIFQHQGESQFSMIFLSANAERTIFVYRGIANEFTLSELLSVPQQKYYYLTTANTKPRIFNQFLKNIYDKSLLIGINPSDFFLTEIKSAELFSLIDILFINTEEADTLLNIKKDKNKIDDFKIGKEIFKKFKLKVLVLTRGRRGSIVFFQNKAFVSDIFKPKIIEDTTGAGDAFASAFLGKLIIDKINRYNLSERHILEAIKWGSANASANIEKLGAQIGILKKKDYLKYKNLNFYLKNI